MLRDFQRFGSPGESKLRSGVWKGGFKFQLIEAQCRLGNGLQLRSRSFCSWLPPGNKSFERGGILHCIAMRVVVEVSKDIKPGG
jgi:hypothetical protein